MYKQQAALCCCVILMIFPVFTEQCTNGYRFERYLGTRTPYRLVSNNSFGKIQYDGCHPKKVWMIVRHGTRNPSASNIEGINDRLPEIKELILESDSLPNEFIKNRDLDLFRHWKLHLDLSDEKKLTHEGEEEMLLLAERMQSRFPDLFDHVYSNSSYKLKFTHSQRTKRSAYYFAAGLFGKSTAKDVWFPEPSKKDPILRFYRLCEKWLKVIKVNVKKNGEHRIFSTTPHVANLVTEVNQRLGLKGELNFSDILIMYIACGFETAWNKRSKSPWCTPFTEDNLKVLEYMEDLKYYWQDGYGHELTYKQACPAFGDMVTFFENVEALPKATVYFSHSGTLLKMLAHMGLYKDSEPLKASSFDTMGTSRKWRTGFIDSFGSNLAFALFDCSGNKKLLTLHQENIVRLPSCPDSDLCDFSKILEFYNQSIESCDFAAMCSHSSRDDY